MRTDKAVLPILTGLVGPQEIVYASFARQLERENNALEQELADERERYQIALIRLDGLEKRIGNAVEILDSIRTIVRGEYDSRDPDTIVAMINGFPAQMRK